MSKHLLFVDNDPGITDMLSTKALILGLAHSVANSASEARSLLLELEPACIILGLSLPNQESFALINELKKSSKNPPKIIVYSSCQNPETAKTALFLGADEFISKNEPLSYLFEQALKPLIA